MTQWFSLLKHEHFVFTFRIQLSSNGGVLSYFNIYHEPISPEFGSGQTSNWLIFMHFHKCNAKNKLLVLGGVSGAWLSTSANVIHYREHRSRVTVPDPLTIWWSRWAGTRCVARSSAVRRHPSTALWWPRRTAPRTLWWSRGPPPSPAPRAPAETNEGHGAYQLRTFSSTRSYGMAGECQTNQATPGASWWPRGSDTSHKTLHRLHSLLKTTERHIRQGASSARLAPGDHRRDGDTPDKALLLLFRAHWHRGHIAQTRCQTSNAIISFMVTDGSTRDSAGHRRARWRHERDKYPLNDAMWNVTCSQET